MELSIIIPAYNEESRIGPTLNDYIDHFEPQYSDDYEIIVITDGCKDRTCEIISEIDSPNIRHFNYGDRLGKGGAISKGYEMSQGRVISYTDADGSTSPEQLWNLVRALDEINCDGVSASRYVEGASMGGSLPLSRVIASRSYNLMVRTLFGLPFKDTQCGAKVFKRPVAKEIFKDLKVTDWAFDVNLLHNAIKRGYDIREIGIHWEDSPSSKVKMERVVPKMFMSTIRLRLLESHFSFIADNRMTRYVGRALKKRWGSG